jgi:hypothetical protein
LLRWKKTGTPRRFSEKLFYPGRNSLFKGEFFSTKNPAATATIPISLQVLQDISLNREQEKKLNVFGRKIIFKPLKMQNTGWSMGEINLARHSRLYEQKGDSIVSVPLYEGTTYPDGGVRSTVEDLSKFFIMLLNDGNYQGKQLLSKEAAKEMLRFQYTNDNKPENIPDITKLNSGIFWSTKLGGRRIGHKRFRPGDKNLYAVRPQPGDRRSYFFQYCIGRIEGIPLF